MNWLHSKLLAYTFFNKRLVSQETIQIPFSQFHTAGHARAEFFSWPYEHLIIDDFLEESAIAQIRGRLEKLESKGSSAFINFKRYDLMVGEIKYTDHPETDFFFDLSYKDAIAELFSLKLTHHTSIAFHRNVPRKENKYIHSDWVPVAFGPDTKQAVLSDTEIGVVREDGTGVEVSNSTIVEMRAITAILYLNPDWKKGMGGATGMFARHGNDYIPVAEIEPRYNRLFMFKNTPHSYHNYIPSLLPERDSLIQWFYTPKHT